MKGNKLTIRVLLICAGIIGTTATYKIAGIILSHASYTKEIAYHFDQQLSQNSRKTIVDYVKNNTHLRPQKLINSICAQFNYIKKVQLCYTPTTIEIDFTAHEPTALINEQYAITDQCLLMEKDNFEQDTCDSLKNVFIHDLHSSYTHQSQHHSYLSDAVRTWINSLPRECKDLVTAHWINEKVVEYVCNDDPHLRIRCTSDHQITSHDINDCRAAKNLAMPKNNKPIFADIRFNQQIILSKK